MPNVHRQRRSPKILAQLQPLGCARFQADRLTLVTDYTQLVTERAIVAKTGVVARELDGSFCLVDTEAWQVAVLNETASDVWRLIQVGCSPEEIIGALSDAYQVDPSVISDDVRAALDDLGAGGFLVVETA